MEHWNVGSIGLQYSNNPLLHHSVLLHRAKLRQSYFRCDVIEDKPHGHADADFLPRAFDHIANHCYLPISAV